MNYKLASTTCWHWPRLQPLAWELKANACHCQPGHYHHCHHHYRHHNCHRHHHYHHHHRHHHLASIKYTVICTKAVFTIMVHMKYRGKKSHRDGGKWSPCMQSLQPCKRGFVTTQNISQGEKVTRNWNTPSPLIALFYRHATFEQYGQDATILLSKVIQKSLKIKLEFWTSLFLCISVFLYFRTSVWLHPLSTPSPP